MRLQQTDRKFAISDIHGCYRTFKKLLKKVNFDGSDHLYVIGDFLNKGPRTQPLFEHLYHLSQKGQLSLIRGNHEQMLLDVYEGTRKRYLFDKMGGLATLKSFGTKKVKSLPIELIEWIHSSPLNLSVDQYIMVHGGIDCTMENPLLEDPVQLTLRNWYHKINHSLIGDRIILHGHSPVKRTVIEFQYQKMLYRNYLDLDSGCAYPMKKGMGYLTIFDMSNQLLFFQKNIESN